MAYVNLVLGAGAGVKEAQSLARHATPTMTMNVYGRADGGRLADLTEAVGAAVLGVSQDPECTESAARKAAGAESLVLATACGNGDAGSIPAASTIDRKAETLCSSQARRDFSAGLVRFPLRAKDLQLVPHPPDQASIGRVHPHSAPISPRNRPSGLSFSESSGLLSSRPVDQNPKRHNDLR